MSQVKVTDKIAALLRRVSPRHYSTNRAYLKAEIMIILSTRKHSSRMRAAHLLPGKGGWYCPGGAVVQGGGVVGGWWCPGRVLSITRSDIITPYFPPPPVDRITDTLFLIRVRTIGKYYPHEQNACMRKKNTYHLSIGVFMFVHAMLHKAVSVKVLLATYGTCEGRSVRHCSAIANKNISNRTKRSRLLIHLHQSIIYYCRSQAFF